ncbi:MAG: tyrosine-type recombinase/integrase [Syntrophobacteraceae bacterium]
MHFQTVIFLHFHAGAHRWRKTVSKDVQDAILEKIKEQTPRSPRIYVAFLFLCTYTAIRPSELLSILEEDINLDTGHIIIRHHKTVRKTKAPRIVPLLPEDVEMIKALPRGFPKMHFFRHDASIKGMPQNTPFGNRILRKVWGRACEACGVEGVDVYGGTRHSTQQFYKQFKSAEDCQRLSMHTTSKAGMRYLEVHRPELVSGYSLARRGGTPGGHGKTTTSDHK